MDGLVARRLGIDLAALLWRFLEAHERCLAAAAAAPTFELVTTVPSGDRARDDFHPLRWIVGGLVEPTHDRYERLLRRSTCELPARAFSPAKYLATRTLSGEAVLLVDDTWTTGANAQSAAASLRAAGSGPVAAVVIGRHLNREWGDNHRRLGMFPPFDWSRCVICGVGA
jgi:predicted amidophosphoribosyltransferase